jgi:hypothetical protein
MNGLAQGSGSAVEISDFLFGPRAECSDTRAIGPSRLIVALSVALVFAGPASAESCTISREYILESIAGDLTRPAKTYDDLFKICIEVLNFANVRDAYVLKDGGIAIVPTHDTVVATAGTLAQFCQRFPKGTARFLTSRERSKTLTVGSIVLMSSADATSCVKIRGMT